MKPERRDVLDVLREVEGPPSRKTFRKASQGKAKRQMQGHTHVEGPTCSIQNGPRGVCLSILEAMRG